MGVGQNLVDLADPAQSPGDRIEAGQPATGRAAGPQRPDAAKPAGGRWLPAHLIATGAPAREAESLGRHVVQRRGKCCKALTKTRGVDRVMRRWEPHPNGMPPGEVVQATGNGGARLRAAAGAAGEADCARDRAAGKRAGGLEKLPAFAQWEARHWPDPACRGRCRCRRCRCPCHPSATPGRALALPAAAAAA